jgi:hypothetical protein
MKTQSNPDIAPLLITAVDGGISRVAVNRNTRHSGISVHRLSWALRCGGAVSGFDWTLM